MAIQFPDISPIAVSLGPLDIRWYALAYLVGFLAGWRYALYLVGLNPNHRPNRDDIDNFIPFAVLGVILGGRIGYVLFYQFDVYTNDPLAILRIWQGGMSFHGGVLGVIASIIGFSVYNKISVLRLADMVCAAVPIGLFLGRLANFVNGELFGRTTTVSWGVIFPYGGEEPRHPSQIYEAVLEGLLLFIILFVLARRSWVRARPGIIAGVFLSGYAMARFSVEFFREPDFHLGFIVQEFSMGQVLSVPMFILGLCVIFFAQARFKKGA